MVDGNAYDTLANLAYDAARNKRAAVVFDAPARFWKEFQADRRILQAHDLPRPGEPFPWFGVEVTVRIITPCGGCGEENPEKRCINCGHKFYG